MTGISALALEQCVRGKERLVSPVSSASHCQYSCVASPCGQVRVLLPQIYDLERLLSGGRARGLRLRQTFLWLDFSVERGVLPGQLGHIGLCRDLAPTMSHWLHDFLGILWLTRLLKLPPTSSYGFSIRFSGRLLELWLRVIMGTALWCGGALCGAAVEAAGHPGTMRWPDWELAELGVKVKLDKRGRVGKRPPPLLVVSFGLGDSDTLGSVLWLEFSEADTTRCCGEGIGAMGTSVTYENKPFALPDADLPPISAAVVVVILGLEDHGAAGDPAHCHASGGHHRGCSRLLVPHRTPPRPRQHGSPHSPVQQAVLGAC
ncbi:hypothetical protein EYF80_007597 [Liparis tanakae]|uniref:Uncharacterized protein n=1 Tax=Liparis tanakae TaxID=230148 RepID=A0A4Z2IW70_9TELE|nr:hypothetical protein EYF80_007597 [Liparis tanakae]